MASEEYFNRQVNKQVYGSGASDFDLNLTHEQRQRLNVYKTYYPNQANTDNQPFNSGANYDQPELSGRTKLIVFGAVGLFALFLIAVNELIDWVGHCSKKLNGGELVFIFMGVICFVKCLISIFKILFMGHLKKKNRSRSYNSAYLTILVIVLLISAFITIGFFGGYFAS